MEWVMSLFWITTSLSSLVSLSLVTFSSGTLCPSSRWCHFWMTLKWFRKFRITRISISLKLMITQNALHKSMFTNCNFCEFLEKAVATDTILIWFDLICLFKVSIHICIIKFPKLVPESQSNSTNQNQIYKVKTMWYILSKK